MSRLQFTTMKAAVFCLIFFSVVMTTLSQPTYDLDQQRFCDGDCQQQDLKDLQDQFTAQLTAVKNEISQLSQLEEQVDNFLRVFTGGGRTTVNGTTLPLPEAYPRSPGGYIVRHYFMTNSYLHDSNKNVYDL